MSSSPIASTVPAISLSVTWYARLHVSGSALFVWSVWAFLLVSGLIFVSYYGSNVPFWDDWTLVGVITGRASLTFAWLWAPNNEHRIPVPKLVSVALIRWSGFDWRSGMYASVFCLALLSAGLICAIRRRRGHTVISDAIFPLALQHLGQKENLLWCFQIGFVLGVVLVGFVLVFLVLGGEKASSWSVLGVAICMLLMPLFGANALAFVLPLSSWLGYLGLTRWRQRGHWALAGAVTACCFCGLYFVDLKKIATPHIPSLADRLAVASQFLSTALGPTVRSEWPLAALMVIGLTVVTCAALLRIWWQDSREKLGTLGILAFLAGFAVLAIGVGWGRAGLDDSAGLRNRYGTLSAPLICGIYCAWGQCLSARQCRFAQVFLFLTLVGLCVPNNLYGIRHGRSGRAALAEVQRSTREPEMTSAALAHTYTRRPQEVLWTEEMEPDLATFLEYLRQDRLGPFRDAPRRHDLK